MNERRSVLVTGGAGYIGSHTVVELYRSGYFPVIADDFRNASRNVISGLNQLLGEDPEIVSIDVCDKHAMRELFSKYDFSGIIHFAAYKAVGESVAEPLKYYRNNIDSLLTVSELALEHGVNNFVFSSSCTVYGEPGKIAEVSENSDKGSPASPYGHTKLIGEAILADLQLSKPEFRVINLRYFNPVGAHPSGLIGEFPIGKPNNLLPYITQTAIGKLEQLTVFGNDYPTADGTCIRDFIHVVDLAKAHVMALNKLDTVNGPVCEAVNIGTGKGTSVRELISVFEDVSGQKLNWRFGPRRSGDVATIYANAAKAASYLNWQPEYSVSDAVEHAWQWEKNLRSNEN